MNMRSPIVAMLWENWQLTRVEAAQRLGLGIVAGSAALALLDAGPTVAFGVLLSIYAVFWLSIAKLNGGKFMDGYRPGFPLYLLYTRPVPTVVFVGIAMAYDAISCVALYLVSAAALGFVFGQQLPLFSVVSWLVAVHFACTCIQWSTRNRVAQWIGSLAIGWPFYGLMVNRMARPLQVEFSFAEHVLLILVSVVSFGIAVAGVARQRRGDDVATVPQPAGSAEYPDWLIAAFRFSCPTSSATRAQVWFELKSSGLPVLTLGLVLAITIFVLFAISIPFVPVRPFAVFSLMVCAPAVLLFFGGNAFGMRRRQGRTYLSSFDATQPYGTAQRAGLKIMVRAACVLTALIVVGLSVWLSSSLVEAWAPWGQIGKADATVGLLKIRRGVGDAFTGLAGSALAAYVVVTSVAVAIMIAWFAAGSALRARYPRRILAGGALLLLYCLSLIVLAVAAENGFASTFLLSAIVTATRWIATAAMVLTTVYLLWSGFAERTLTTGYVSSVLVISAAFGAAWLTVLQAAGVQLGEMRALDAVWILSPVLLPLMASVLSPWSFNRIRHT
jgi:hypothetical protein